MKWEYLKNALKWELRSEAGVHLASFTGEFILDHGGQLNEWLRRRGYPELPPEALGKINPTEV